MPAEPVAARVALGLGANLGDRLATLQSAVDVITADPQVQPVGVSPVIETDPVGGPDQPEYLNAVLVVDTTLPPIEVLALCQLAEQLAHRTREVRWGPRTLDVDVLSYGEQISTDPVLTLPHPRATERGFVLVPWAAVDPHYQVPGTCRTVRQLLRELGSGAETGIRHPVDVFLRID